MSDKQSNINRPVKKQETMTHNEKNQPRNKTDDRIRRQEYKKFIIIFQEGRIRGGGGRNLASSVW